MTDEVKTVTLIIKSTTEGIDQAKAKLTELGATYTQTERTVNSQTSSLEKLAAKYNDIFRIGQQYTVQQAQLQRAAETYTQKTGDAAKAAELLGLGLTGLAQKHDIALARALANAEGLNGLAAASARAAAASAELDARAQALRDRLDPAAVAQRRLAAAIAENTTLLQAGKISYTEYAAAMALMDKQAASGIVALTELDARMKRAAASNAELTASMAAANAEVAAREAQSAINSQLGISAPTAGAAAASAAVFVEAEQKAKAEAAAIAELDARAQALRDRLDPAAVAQRKFAAAIAESTALLQAGKISYAEHEAAVRLANNEVAAGIAAFGAAGKAVDGLASAQVRARGASGRMREGLVLVHEFLRGDWKRAVGSATIELQNFGLLGLIFNPITLGIIGVVGAIALMVKATADFESSQAKLALAIKSTGDDVGLTKGQLDGLAQSTSAGTDLSVKSARAVETELMAGGRIGGDVFTRLVGVTSDYAKVTGETADKAAGSLNKIFLDPSKGAKELDASLNLLSATQLHEIESAQKSGDVDRARSMLLDALTSRIKGASKEVSGFASSWDALAKAISNAYDALGRAGAPETIDAKITRLKKESDAQQQRLAVGNDIIGDQSGIVTNDPNFAPRPLSAAYSPPTIASTEAAAQGASDPSRELQNLLRIRGHQEDDAAAAAEAAANLEIGKSYDVLAEKLDPLIQKHRDLTDELGLVDNAFKHGVIDLAAWQQGAAALQTTIDNLRSPLQEAQARLGIERQVNAVSPAQRPALRAQLTETLTASQNPQTAGQAGQLGAIAGQAASAQSATAATDAVKQANLNADAQGRLAAAAGLSSDAMRKAANDNAIAAFAYQHGGVAVDQYRAAIEKASAAEKAHEINATVLGLTQQAQAAERLAGVSGQGAAAVHSATIANEAYALTLKAGTSSQSEFNAVYQQYLALLQRNDAAVGEAAVQKEIRASQDALAIAQAEGDLLNGNVETRGRELAILKEKQKLLEQFPTATQAEIDQVVALHAEEGKQTAINDQKKQAEKDFQQLARQGVQTIVQGFEDAVTHAKTFGDVINSVGQSLSKIGLQYFVEKPTSEFLDKQIGSGGIKDTLSNLFGAGGEKPKANDNFGADAAPLQALNGKPAVPGSDGLTAAANDLTQSAGSLTNSASNLNRVPDVFSKLFGQQLTSTMNVQAASVTVTGGVSGGSSSASGLGSLFNSSGSDTGSSYADTGGGVYDTATYAQYTGGAGEAFRNGAAFRNGNVVPFASGGITSGPTYFPMSGGRTGLMGEAGEEGIMPLRRNSRGQLGVMASGQGGNTTHFTQNNHITLQGDGDMAERFGRSAGQQARRGLNDRRVG